MLGTLPTSKKNLGAPLQSRKAMLETLFRHLDMVRLSAGAALMVMLTGCLGLITGPGGGNENNARKTADELWNGSALPVLKGTCATCHNGSQPNIGFLIGSDDDAIHDNLLKYSPPVVNLEAPASSRILSKGLHNGPALLPDQTYPLLQWIQAEKNAEATGPDGTPPQSLTTPPFAVTLCPPGTAAGACPVNQVKLSTIDGVGAAVGDGAMITFVAQGLTSGLYLNNLKLVGGAPGVYIEHPLFVSRPAGKDAFPDQIDRYFASKVDVAPNTTSQIEGGTASFAGFDPAAMVEIHFKVVTAFKPDSAPAANAGCKALAMFKAKAAPQLQTNCASCHAANGNNAKVNMDLTGVNSADDATALQACNQVKSRINLTQTDQSGFYLAPAPAPGSANHPLHLSTALFTTFKGDVDLWVQAEKTAP